jgi:Flp pilus assembly protein TadD
MDVTEAFDEAQELHQAGKVAEAEPLYRQVIAARPDDHAALALLGVLLMQTGRAQTAVDFLTKAASLCPANPEYHLNRGAALDFAGRLDEAVAAYREALSRKSDYAQVLSNLGNALRRQGKAAEAVDMCRRAISVRPEFAEAHNNLGLALVESGQYGPAIDAHARAVTLRPNSDQFMFNLSLALQRAGRPADAVRALRRTISMSPVMAEAWNHLGQVLTATGEPLDAEAACRQAIALNPHLASAYQNLAKALLAQGKAEEAIKIFRDALPLGPTAELHNNIGMGLLTSGRRAEAIGEFRTAIRLDHTYAFAHNNLGAALFGEGDLENAVASFRTALALAPDYFDAHNTHNNLGTAIKYLGRFDEATKEFNLAISLRPDYPSPHWNLGLTRLLRGDLPGGWPEYEWRWRVPELKPPPRDTSRPQWDGGELDGRRILLYTEQGFGDAIQFVRFAETAARRGGKVILRCQRELVRLFKTAAGVEQVIDSDSPPGDYDVQSPLMSLPLVLKTDLAGIPRQVPYLSADAEGSARWRERLSGDGRRKIGLAWAGLPSHPKDRDRSVQSGLLSPLAGIAGARFISLQKAGPGGPAPAAGATFELADWTDELEDFADTAALVANLDLVICVDTSVAHLSAAMGKPTWVLLPWVPDWRWMLDRSDSPWYPTVRLFRQKTRGDWSAPLAELFEALKSS